MKRVSSKRAALMRVVERERDLFRSVMQSCMICGVRAVDVHEIAQGAAREAALAERCAWLLLCRRCHADVHDQSEWPIARQLALKLLRDCDFLDIDRVCELRGRAVGAITLGEVVAHLEMVDLH